MLTLARSDRWLVGSPAKGVAASSWARVQDRLHSEARPLLVRRLARGSPSAVPRAIEPPRSSTIWGIADPLGGRRHALFFYEGGLVAALEAHDPA